MPVPPLVSVIIPAFNMAEFIDRTIDSAVNQTHRELEVIVVDDGSTDATCDIVQKWAARDSRIRLLRQPNAGVAAARNNGIRASSGEFIAPLDADDLWRHEKIELQLRRFRACSAEVALVYCSSMLIDIDDYVLRGPERNARFVYEGRILHGLVWGNFGCASVPLIRREPLIEAGGYDSGLRRRGGEGCEDKQLYIHLAERWPMARVPHALVGYRVRTNSMSYKSRSMHRSHYLVVQEALTRNRIPSKIARWSQAKADVTFAARSYSMRDYPSAARLFVQAAARDPAYVVARFMDRLLFGAGITKPVVAERNIKFFELGTTKRWTAPPHNAISSTKYLTSAIITRREKYISELCSRSVLDEVDTTGSSDIRTQVSRT
jgi:glycosyltransferase involved in cell wall biosynthesis